MANGDNHIKDKDKLANLCQAKNPDHELISKLVSESSKKEVLGACRDNTSVCRHVLAATEFMEETQVALELRSKVSDAIVRELLESSTKGPSSSDQNGDLQTKLDIFMHHLDTANPPWTDSHLTATVETIVAHLEESVGGKPVSEHALTALARLICVAGERPLVVTDENEMEGVEYRKKLVRKLCLERWAPNDAVNRVKMFKDVVDLNPEELDLVVEKACTIASKMASQNPMDIPPLVFQVLVLCRGMSSGLTPAASTRPRLICALAKLYQKSLVSIMKKSEDMDSADMIDAGVPKEAVFQSEGTVIYHLLHAIRMGHPVEKDVLKLLRSASQLPECVLENRFVLFVSLALASVKQHQATVVECLKAAICKNIALTLKSCTSAWLRQTLPEMGDVAEAFSGLLEQTSKYGGWDLIGQGSVDVALSLLDFNAPFKPKMCQAVWGCAKKILSSVVALRAEPVREILNQLVKRIIYSGGAVQYTDTLRQTIREGLSVVLEEPKSVIQELLEQLGSLGAAGAKRVILAIMPLLEAARKSLRNSAILTLRKSLFSTNLETRRVAIIGVLQLLKHFKIKSTAGATQFGMSQMLMSQSASSSSLVDVHRGVAPPNEGLCMELVGVLQRGLSSHSQVRITLYNLLQEVVDRNSELCLDLVNLIHSHADSYRMNCPNNVSPIDVEAMVVRQPPGGETNSVDQGPVVLEPIGWFLRCVQGLIVTADRVVDSDSDDTQDLEKLKEMLSMLAQKYSTADVADLGFDKATANNAGAYSRSNPTGRLNCLRVDTFKNIYESLMDHCIQQNICTKVDQVELLVKLHKRWEELDALLKGSPAAAAKPKTKKGEAGGKKADDTIDLAKKLASTGGPLNPSQSHQVPENCFSLKGVAIVLRALLTDRDPSHHPSVSKLREQRSSFKHYLMKVALETLTQVEKDFGTEYELLNKKYLVEMTEILYANCLFNQEADIEVMPSCLECLLKAIHIAHKHLHSHLTMVYAPVSKEETELVPLMGKILDSAMSKVDSLSEMETSSQMDTEEKKMVEKSVGILVTLITYWIRQLPPTTSKGTEVLKRVNEWVMGHMRDKMSEDEKDVNLRGLLDLLFATTVRVSPNPKIFTSVCRAVHEKLGTLNQTAVAEDSGRSSGMFGFVGKGNVSTVLELVMTYLDVILDAADSVIARCRQTVTNRDAGLTVNPTNESPTGLTEFETGVCHSLAYFVNATSELVQTELPLGPGLEGLVKLLTKFYTTTAQLSKYFFLRCKTTREAVKVSRFDKLLEKVGCGHGSLTKNVYAFINHIQTLETEESSNTSKEKKKNYLAKNRASKDHRMIPNLVFKIEALEKDLIRLSNRCKYDLLSGWPKASTSRDFRLKMNQVPPDRQPEEEEEDEEDDDDENEEDENKENRVEEDGEEGEGAAAESTRIDEASQKSRSGEENSPPQNNLSQASSVRAEMGKTKKDISSEEPPPPAKKMKVKMDFKKRRS